ncbi:MAG: CDP-glycerol glycerophosphotransferase family protein [Butyrivibrio sp.]|nr:CDP-glycerol glycerophosphotransferase family protein [Butyrivibrio sp.]
MTETKELTATVTEISWERVLLRIRVDLVPLPGKHLPAAPEFYLVDEKGFAGAYFDIEEASDHSFLLRVNITNNGNRRVIPAGFYRINVCEGDRILAEFDAAPEITPCFEERSRVFLYGQKIHKSYGVSFFVLEDNSRLPFRMDIINAEEMPITWLRKDCISISKTFQHTFCDLRVYVTWYYRILCRLFGRHRATTILFINEQSERLGANLTAIRDRMQARGLDRKYTRLSWSHKKLRGQNNLRRWFSLIHILARSGIVFVDDHVPTMDWLVLRPDTTVIQTWHAGAGFKSSGYSRFSNIGGPPPLSAHRQYTYGLCGSRKIAHFFSEVWGIDTERVLNTGMPRMDEYQDPEYRQKTTQALYERYPLCRDKQVILFAPTYRGKNVADAYYPYELIDWERLDAVTGDHAVVLFRMHPWVNKPISIPERYAGKFIDVADYPGINDLFYITDLLITDYSSNIYEYSLMRRPMLFYAFDEIQYSFSRGFHRPYRESAPGKVCTTFAELCDAIAAQDYEAEKVEAYVTHHFDHFDSGACDRVIDWLIEGELPADIRTAIAAREARTARMLEVRFPVHIERPR